MRWGFVWGRGSQNYSEEVIKSYICSQARLRNSDRQLSYRALAGLHKGGFPQGLRQQTHKEFGMRVQQTFRKARTVCYFYIAFHLCVIEFMKMQ